MAPNAPRPDNPARPVRIDDDLWARVKAIAREDGTTASKVVRTAVERYVEQREESDGASAEDFAYRLREEAVRRADNRYVHHAVIRNQMRDMADTIVRWERGWSNERKASDGRVQD